MPRRWLKANMPTHHQMRRQLGAASEAGEQGERYGTIRQWMIRKITDPAFWRMNRHSVAGGVATGLFVAWLPIPMQMLVAAILAACLRVHVPVSVMMVWFSNPITFPPLLYAAWYMGSTILGKPILETPLDLSITVLLDEALHSWPEILVGSLFCAAVTAVLGFFITYIVWRAVAIRRWRKRRAKHRMTTAAQSSKGL